MSGEIEDESHFGRDRIWGRKEGGGRQEAADATFFFIISRQSFLWNSLSPEEFGVGLFPGLFVVRLWVGRGSIRNSSV